MELMHICIMFSVLDLLDSGFMCHLRIKSLFLYVYFSALISSASFRLLTVLMFFLQILLLIFHNYCFRLLFLLRSSLQQCYNTRYCNAWQDNLLHLQSVLTISVYLHLLLLLLFPVLFILRNNSYSVLLLISFCFLLQLQY